MIEKRKKIFFKVTFYYSLIIAVITLISIFQPWILSYLPIGGLNQTSSTQVFNSIQEEILTTSNRPLDTFRAAIQLVMALVGTILVMLPLRWVYFEASFGQHRQAIAANLILLPLIVTGIVAIVQNSLALAFSLAGIVAGVSYRTRLKDSSDALYIFAAIGVGLAAGTQSMGIALVMSMFFTYTVIIIPPKRDDEIKGGK